MWGDGVPWCGPAMHGDVENRHAVILRSPCTCTAADSQSAKRRVSVSAGTRRVVSVFGFPNAVQEEASRRVSELDAELVRLRTAVEDARRDGDSTVRLRLRACV